MYVGRFFSFFFFFFFFFELTSAPLGMPQREVKALSCSGPRQIFSPAQGKLSDLESARKTPSHRKI
jgi:hypothetical protein